MRKMYTEQQISDIAKSSVSGGTKLYLHEINFSNATGLFLITTNEEEIELISELKSAFLNSITARYHDLDGAWGTVLAVDTTNLEYYSNAMESIEMFNFESLTILDDVTPL